MFLFPVKQPTIFAIKNLCFNKGKVHTSNHFSPLPRLSNLVTLWFFLIIFLTLDVSCYVIHYTSIMKPLSEKKNKKMLRHVYYELSKYIAKKCCPNWKKMSISVTFKFELWKIACIIILSLLLWRCSSSMDWIFFRKKLSLPFN